MLNLVLSNNVNYGIIIPILIGLITVFLGIGIFRILAIKNQIKKASALFE